MSEGITTEVVFACLQSSLSQDNVTRSAAEKQLQAWESDSVPGFIGSLLKIAQEPQVPEVRGSRNDRRLRGAELLFIGTRTLCQTKNIMK